MSPNSTPAARRSADRFPDAERDVALLALGEGRHQDREAAGATTAAPRPWRARAPISDGSFHASAARSDAPGEHPRP